MSPSTFGLELEDAILGALPQEGRIPKGADYRLTPDMFSPSRRPIARAILTVGERTGACDLFAVQEELTRNGEGINTVMQLAKLIEAVPSPAHLQAHIILLRERAGLESLTGPVLVALADVQPEPISWLWPEHIPLGKLTLIVGDPGLGKSFLLVDMAARVSVQAPWPDGGAVARGKVILLTAEDGLADTVRPRLDTMGGDPASVLALKGVRRKGTDGASLTEVGLSLARDVQELEAAIEESGAIMVGIDPLSAYLGRTDSYKDAEVRGLLAPLAALAERKNVAVVGIMHLSKDAQRRALYRAQGSLAFVAAARAVFVVTADQDNPDRRLFLPLKLNVAAKPPGLAFSIPYDPAGPSRLVWSPDPVEIDVEDALSDPQSSGEREDRQGAATFLQELLADGDVLSKDVFRLGRENGFSDKAIRKARGTLGIKPRKEGFGRDGRWYWGLPKVPTKMTSPKEEDILAESQYVSVDRKRVSPKMPNAQDEDILAGHDQPVLWEEEL
ncbi:MAG: AAA family ATPase [Nitrospiraceae bacterium]